MRTHVQAIGMSLVAFIISLAAILSISTNANASAIKLLDVNPVNLEAITKVERAAVAARGAIARPSAPVYSGGDKRDRR